MVPQSIYNDSIRDYHNKYNNMERLEIIARITKMWHRAQSEQMPLEKMVLRFALFRVATNL